LVVPVATPLPIEQRADLKLGADGARRRVEAIEHFQEAVKRGDAIECAIQAAADETGWPIGFSGSLSTAGKQISAVGSLFVIQKWGTTDLRRTLALAAHWRGDKGASSNHWLLALGLLIRDGYDEKFTPATFERCTTLSPAVTIRQAQGLVSAFGARGNGVKEVHLKIAGLVRKHLGLRKQPARRVEVKGPTPNAIP